MVIVMKDKMYSELSLIHSMLPPISDHQLLEEKSCFEGVFVLF